MLKFYAFQLWEWLVIHGIPLTALVIIAVLIPRVGRLAIRIVSNRFNEGEEATKSRLALVGALVYVLQAIAYFAIIMLGLTNLGVPAMGAALPATVVSAAIGFGAQNVIGDFLAGFFIISERQFGVGDFVAFDGTSNDISGTVVGLTLRATKVRTASGEVVTIPNGSAGVITNYSQDWSRAVVDLAVPLQPGESMSQLTDRVEATAAKALGDPTIAGDVTGKLEVLPATDIVAPSAAGQSWQVNFRVMVVVNPARQWAVERVLRSALVNVFWDRYDMPRVFRDGRDAQSSTALDPIKAVAMDSGLTPTEVLPAQNTSKHRPSSAAPVSPVSPASPASPVSPASQSISGNSAGIADSASDEAKSGLAPRGTASAYEAAAKDAVQAEGADRASQLAQPGQAAQAGPAEAAAQAGPAGEAAQAEQISQGAKSPTTDGPGVRPLDSDGTIGRTRSASPEHTQSAATADSGSGSGGDSGPADKRDADTGNATTDWTARIGANAHAGAGAEDSAEDSANGADDTDGADDAEKGEKFQGIWRSEQYASKFKRIMSVGGRTRPSTTGLIFALLLVGGLALASSNPEGGDTGWLSPDYWRDRPSNSASTEDSEANKQSDESSTSQNNPTSDPSSDSNSDSSSNSNSDSNTEPSAGTNPGTNTDANSDANSGSNSGANSDQNANSTSGGGDGSRSGTANEPNNNSNGNPNSGNGGVQNNSNNSGTGGNSMNGAAPRAMGATSTPNATDTTHG
ncbi:mechanosensitive ion channel family protein [Corynebacterium jeikeium]|uniref:mechanosensitive ion channel family protein n=1 Tax=Corynebacterium jeikeium TaxID=38289 RepID=UPI00055440D4|nr:mechanosensitive ion channel family protein [Corynebacterium jeikeium]